MSSFVLEMTTEPTTEFLRIYRLGTVVKVRRLQERLTKSGASVTIKIEGYFNKQTKEE